MPITTPTCICVGVAMGVTKNPPYSNPWIQPCFCYSSVKLLVKSY